MLPASLVTNQIDGRGNAQGPLRTAIALKKQNDTESLYRHHGGSGMRGSSGTRHNSPSPRCSPEPTCVSLLRRPSPSDATCAPLPAFRSAQKPAPGNAETATGSSVAPMRARRNDARSRVLPPINFRLLPGDKEKTTTGEQVVSVVRVARSTLDSIVSVF